MKDDAEDEQKEDTNGILHPIAEDDFTIDNLQGEVLQFPTNCNSCGSPCETNMKVTSKPIFNINDHLNLKKCHIP